MTSAYAALMRHHDHEHDHANVPIPAIIAKSTTEPCMSMIGSEVKSDLKEKAAELGDPVGKGLLRYISICSPAQVGACIFALGSRAR